jgi:hypothetical protein
VDRVAGTMQSTPAGETRLPATNDAPAESPAAGIEHAAPVGASESAGRATIGTGPGVWQIVLCWAITTAIAVIGVSFGCDFVKPNKPAGFIDSCAQWDGQHYARIIETGYDYDPTRQSEVAFFPGYPVLAGAIAWLPELGAVPALLIVSNACTLGALLLMGLYLSRREPGDGAAPLSPTAPDRRREAQYYAILALGLFPTTFFFHMAYSESLFICIAIACLLAIQRDWGPVVVALLIGLATAVRPMGVALLAPMVWYLWNISTNQRQFGRRLLLCAPLACWGLIAYIIFQAWAFGEPFAFLWTQKFWQFRPPAPIGEKLCSLLAWEPIWGAYVPGSLDYWREPEGIANPLFSLAAANPIYFMGAVGLIAWGGFKRWLTTPEVLLSAGMLAIPYLSRGYETCMASQGRFAAVAFPAYIVIGHLLARLPAALAIALLVFSGFLMAAHAALFAAGYSLI